MSAKKIFLIPGIVVLLFCTAYFSTSVLNLLHHYTNFVVLGRSTTKVFGLLLWILLIFSVPFLKTWLDKKTTLKWFKRGLTTILILSAIGTIFSFILLQKNNLPLKTVLYAVDNLYQFSFNQITHSHILKPALGILSPIIKNADFGIPWFHTMHVELGIPTFFLYLFYGIVFCALVGISIFSVFRTIYFETISGKLLFALASFSLIKSVIDGGLLNAESLISLAVIFILVKKPLFAISVIPLLIADYFLLFTPQSDFITRALLQIALFVGLYIFSCEIKAPHKKIWSFTIGIVALCSFFYFGYSSRFFMLDSEPTAGGHAAMVLSASSTIYFFTSQSTTTPSSIVLTKPETVDSFIKTNNVIFENYPDSIKVDGKNCSLEKSIFIFNKFEIVGKDPSSFPNSTKQKPWYEARKMNNEFLRLDLNSCLPNRLVSSLKFLKSLFPEDKVNLIKI